MTIGLYFVIADIHISMEASNKVAQFFPLLLGFTFTFGGIYIAIPVLAELVARQVKEHMQPYLNTIPGGRRKTDPPLQAPLDVPARPVLTDHDDGIL